MTNTITTELRESMVDDARGLLYIGETALADLCDRIDAVHANLEAENESLRRELDRVLGEQEGRDGWVRLPVDADGEVIHVGDVMDGYGKTIEVVELRIGRSGWVLISRDGNGYADTFAFAHHKPPTVEDVLEEMYDALDDARIPNGSEKRTYKEIIAEYAAKLRLAGES